MPFFNFFPKNDKSLIARFNALQPRLITHDSASLAILNQFQEFAICDGGDDSVAHIDTIQLLERMSQHLTPADIETYDQSKDEDLEDALLPIYMRIRDQNILI